LKSTFVDSNHEKEIMKVIYNSEINRSLKFSTISKTIVCKKNVELNVVEQE